MAEREKEVEVDSSATDGAGGLMSLRLENLAGQQRVSEPGNAIKSRGSRSSSAAHLSGTHTIIGIVFRGLCTIGCLRQHRE